MNATIADRRQVSGPGTKLAVWEVQLFLALRPDDQSVILVFTGQNWGGRVFQDSKDSTADGTGSSLRRTARMWDVRDRVCPWLLRLLPGFRQRRKKRTAKSIDCGHLDPESVGRGDGGLNQFGLRMRIKERSCKMLFDAPKLFSLVVLAVGLTPALGQSVDINCFAGPPGVAFDCTGFIQTFCNTIGSSGVGQVQPTNNVARCFTGGAAPAGSHCDLTMVNTATVAGTPNAFDL
ncbi:hypothetical protein B0H13DRAFT_1914671 [Mycena leptocephala]|nr:hypothetical protein B0H13DRAFT_1914671 [Mycena leptocephala]